MLADPVTHSRPKTLSVTSSSDTDLLWLAHWAATERDPLQQARARLALFNAFEWLGNWKRAGEQLDLLEKLVSNHPLTQRARGTFLFRQGKIADGLAVYDSGRWQLEKFSKIKRPYPFAQWSGQSLKGKKLLVWAEQGIGDQIMQARILPELIAQGADLTVECEPRLIPILRRAVPQARYETQTVPLVPALLNDQFDYQISMFSAWRWTKNPGRFAPVIKPHSGLAKSIKQKWRARDNRAKEVRNIGLSWFSRAASTGEKRSVPLEGLKLLADVAGERVRFHNLQYGDHNAEELTAKFGAQIHTDPAIDPLINLDRAAAQIAALDLVITIDNATAHMAGALGVPTWILLPKGSEFRWGEKDKTTELYPSAQLFRAQDLNRWGGTVFDMADALGEWLQGPLSRSVDAPSVSPAINV